jgi:uncharacterized protein (DUF1499 family)
MILSLFACAVSVVGLLLLAAAGPVYRLGGELPTAFAVLRWAAYLGLAGAATSLAAGGFAYWKRRRVPTAVALVALVIGLTAAAIPYAWQRRAQNVPPIHDISTDLDNPPAFEAIVPLRDDAANTLERPPMLAAQQREGYPGLAPVTLSMPPAQAFDRALAVAQDNGWDIVTADKASGRIEATDTTFWFGFKDDVAVRLTPWGAGTRVDVRSASRVGRSDVGTNARRIEAFLDALQKP